jgi:hypothetical protein
VFIIASLIWIGPTQGSGEVAYGSALICCCIAWLRAKAGGRTKRLAAALMILEGALLFDMFFNWRWKLHQSLMDLAIRNHDYSQRRSPQVIVVALLVFALLSGLIFAWRSFRHRGMTLLAVSGALLSLVLWCVEVVSLHYVDHVLYYSLGGFMSVSLLWLVACSMTSIGILLDPR